MISPILIQRRQRRYKAKVAARTPTPPPPPGDPLVLQSVAYDPSGATVTLTFDRDIDVSAFDGSQVTVVDGLVNQLEYSASDSATQPMATQVTLTLVSQGSDTEAVQNLSATALTGIVAVDDGGTWAGVMDQPFSSTALNLIAAEYDPAGLTTTLNFDRAVSIADLDASQITVNDGEFNDTQYAGTSATLAAPTQIVVNLTASGSFTGSSATLTATALTRIFAEDDGGTWAGVTDLPLGH